jgi:hypothetical protein
MNQIGSSQILPNKRGYTLTLEALRPKLERNKIKTLTLVCNKMNHMKNNPDKFIAQLIKSKTKKRELKYTNKNDLLLIWSKIASMKNINEKRIALQKINRTILHNFNTRLPYPCITFPFSKHLDLFKIKKLCFTLTTATLHPDTAQYINKSMQHIPKKLRSIKDILTNGKKIQRQAQFYCAGKPWCNDLHFSKDLKDMGESFTQIGTVNANYIPHPTNI